MNYQEFYSNLQEYKNNLKHGMYDQKGNNSYQPKYYQKVDMGKGKPARYFYSKEEYDAYNAGKKAGDGFSESASITGFSRLQDGSANTVNQQRDNRDRARETWDQVNKKGPGAANTVNQKVTPGVNNAATRAGEEGIKRTIYEFEKPGASRTVNQKTTGGGAAAQNKREEYWRNVNDQLNKKGPGAANTIDQSVNGGGAAAQAAREAAAREQWERDRAATMKYNNGTGPNKELQQIEKDQAFKENYDHYMKYGKVDEDINNLTNDRKFKDTYDDLGRAASKYFEKHPNGVTVTEIDNSDDIIRYRTEYSDDESRDDFHEMMEKSPFFKYLSNIEDEYRDKYKSGEYTEEQYNYLCNRINNIIFNALFANNKNTKTNTIKHSITGGRGMTREEFYSNLQEYKENIKHGLYDQRGNNSYQPKYYQKIDLGNGKSRYFYTKEEYDAYKNGGTAGSTIGYQIPNFKRKPDQSSTGGGAAAQARREAEARNKWEKTGAANTVNQSTSGGGAAAQNKREEYWRDVKDQVSGKKGTGSGNNIDQSIFGGGAAAQAEREAAARRKWEKEHPKTKTDSNYENNKRAGEESIRRKIRNDRANAEAASREAAKKKADDAVRKFFGADDEPKESVTINELRKAMVENGLVKEDDGKKMTMAELTQTYKDAGLIKDNNSNDEESETIKNFRQVANDSGIYKNTSTAAKTSGDSISKSKAAKDAWNELNDSEKKYAAYKLGFIDYSEVKDSNMRLDKILTPAEKEKLSKAWLSSF